MYLNHNQTDPSYQNAHPIIYWITLNGWYIIGICIIILLILRIINKKAKNKKIQKAIFQIAPIATIISFVTIATIVIYTISSVFYERTITYNGTMQVQSISKSLNDDLTKDVVLKQNDQTRTTRISNDKLKNIKPKDHVKIIIQKTDHGEINLKKHIKFNDIKYIGPNITKIKKTNK